jgi:hypothetical protein
MRLSESDKKQVRVVLVMVLVLAAPAMLLYLLYVNSQRDYFTDRNLRLLSVVSKQLVTGIENYQNAFASLVDSVKSELAAARGQDKANPVEVSKAPGPGATAAVSAPSPQPLREANRDAGQVTQKNLYRLNMSLKPRMQMVQDSPVNGLTQPPKQGSSTRIKLVSEQSEYWLHMLYDGGPDKAQPGATIHVRVNANDFVGQFIGKDVWVGA